MLRRLAAGFCALLFLAAGLPTARAGSQEIPYKSYTYDNNWEEQAAPPLYLPADASPQALTAPSDLHIYKDRLYILDSGEGVLHVTDPNMEVWSALPLLSSPGVPMEIGPGGGLFVCDYGIYVTDPQGLCVYRFDLDGVLQHTFTQPNSPLYDHSILFSVRRVLVDGAGNLFALVAGMYDGAVIFSEGDEFLGFYGANQVEMAAEDRLEQFWKGLLSREQQAAMTRFVPIAYTSFDIDEENFVYTCSQDAVNESTRVRKLNPSGKSLWDDQKRLFGDFFWDGQKVSGLQNSSQLTDVCIDTDGTLSVLDSAKGRVFQYDSNGYLMGAFGGKGKQLGTFTEAVSIETWGDFLYVLDAKECSVTRFSLTAYGTAYRQAIKLYNDGEYIQAKTYWQEVLRQNRFSEPACVGMGKALYAEGDIGGSLSYLRQSQDRYQYSLVFGRFRMEFVRANFSALVAGAAAVTAAVLVLRKLKWLGLGKYLDPLKKHLSVVFHPISGVEDLLSKKKLSILFSSCVVICWLLLDIVRYFAGGFPFNRNLPQYFNLASSLVGTVLVFLLWAAVNWSISTLSDGKGTAKAIYCTTAYALIPYIVSQALWVLLSQVLTQEEGMFLTLIAAVGVLWSAFLLLAIVMTIHQYTIGKTVGNIFMTLLGIMVVIVVLILLVVLFEHVMNLFQIIYNELTLRR